jgi:hypothetical protein
MAAETLTGTRAASTFPVYKPLGAGQLATAWGSYSIAANVEDGDIWELCRIPAGAVVVGGAFWATDIDIGTEAVDIDVGWAANGTEAADPDGFVNSGVLTGDAITDLLAAGNNYRPFVMSAGPFSFTNETIIQAEANVAAATFASGTIYVRVDYTVA